MTFHRAIGRAGFAALVLAAGFATAPAAKAKTLLQGTYDMCQEPYEEKFRAMKRSKAMVIGWRGNDSSWYATCYWSWGKATTQEAVASSMKRCREKYKNCSIWATDGTLANWVRRISDNGGRAPGGSSGGGNAAANAFMQGFMGGLAGAMGGSSGYSMPSGGGYAPSQPAGNCAAEEQRLQRSVNQLQSTSGSMGICAAAQASQRLYREAASFHRRCVPGSAGQAQAAEYDRAAAQASRTAASAC